MVDKFFVTGATGFIGSHLIDLLSKRNCEITCFIQNETDLIWIEEHIKNNRIKLYYGDCRNKDDLRNALESNVDYIIHLAGIMNTKNPDNYYKINVGGTKNLLEILIERNLKIKRFIYISSVTSAGPSKNREIIIENCAFDPITDYGKSKLEAEKLIKKFLSIIPYTILRPSLVFGSRNKGTIFSYFQFASSRLKPLLGDGLTNVIHVKDLADMILISAFSDGTSGKSYFIGEDEQFSYREISDIITKAVGKRTITIRFPMFFVLIAGAILGGVSKITGKYPIFDLRRAKDLRYRYWIYDVSKFFTDTGYKIKYPFRKTAKETADWYKKMGWIN